MHVPWLMTPSFIVKPSSVAWILVHPVSFLRLSNTGSAQMTLETFSIKILSSMT